jgi:hypothetical protein
LGLSARVAFARDGATCEYRVLLDTDNDPTTGCSVGVDDKNINTTVAGIDQIVIARVDRFTNPPSVQEIVRRVCSGGTFEPELPVSPGVWNVGENNGINGADVVEGLVTRGDLGDPNMMRVVFVAECAVPVSDVLLSTNGQLGGPQILFDLFPHVVPTLSATALGMTALLLTAIAVWSIRRGVSARRGLLIATLAVAGIAVVALAGNIVLDGQVTDWSGIAPIATDLTGDSSTNDSAEDIVACFMTADPVNVYFRFDLVDLTLEK